MLASLGSGESPPRAGHKQDKELKATRLGNMAGVVAPLFITALIAPYVATHAYDNGGIGALPLMGWSTWCTPVLPLHVGSSAGHSGDAHHNHSM